MTEQISSMLPPRPHDDLETYLAWLRSIRRVFCVGRNYAAHAREMGKDSTREPPFFFMKPADAVVDAKGVIPYPSLTTDLHHEIEMVVALQADDTNIQPNDALTLVWGYGVGVDLTRRDIQDEAKKLSRPWDCAKGFDASAPCSPIHPLPRWATRSKVRSGSR
jgi:fumarylpyruvate hydrolase